MEENNKNTRIEKVKKHIKEHKEAYIAGATGVAIGACGMLTYCLVTGKFNKVVMTDVMVNSSGILPITKNNIHHTHINIVDKRRTEPVKPCRDMGTGETFDSQNHAAEVLGVSRSAVSKHLNGKTDNLNGHKLQSLKPVW